MIEVLKNIKEILAQNLVRLREKRNWTQQKLADEATLSLRGVQQIEYKQRWPRPQQIKSLADAFGVDEYELFSPEGDRAPSIDEALTVLTRFVSERSSDNAQGHANVLAGIEALKAGRASVHPLPDASNKKKRLK